MEREPGRDQRCDDDEKANVSKAAVRVFKRRDLHLAGLLEKPDGGSVFVEGRDAGVLADAARSAIRRDTIGGQRPGAVRSFRGPLSTGRAFESGH